MLMMKNISILIPTYNYDCTLLAMQMASQAAALGIDYEVIVADDGSTLSETIAANRAINDMPCCRYMERRVNTGRAAIRNFLAREARYDWLLFSDSDMVVRRADFMRKYAESDDCDIIDGGVEIANVKPGNLRGAYEQKHAHEHTVEQRTLHPYHDFHTANFLIRREVMLSHPFDERFRRYGYEDVLFGKEIEKHQVSICHIDNPLSFEVFETNVEFVNKTEEGLRTLYTFRHELRGYSRLLRRAESLPHYPILLWHRLMGALERRNLTGWRPRLWLLNVYKLGYLVSIMHRHQD